MEIKHNISLKPYNTFGIDVKASTFIEIFSLEELTKVLQEHSQVFVLGGGSNLLLMQDITIPVLKINLKGIEIVKNTSELVWVKANAGENWHQFVMYCLGKDFGGVENLALIPGNVGTTPVQNIGAYGVEIKDIFICCQAMNIQTKQIHTFYKEDCQFAYRESVFKTSLKGKYIITSVTFCLTTQNHTIRKEYGAIEQFLEKKGIKNPTIHDIAQSVIEIRKSKLPDPKILGNSGSFFKNPVIQRSFFDKLYEKYPQMPHYIISDTEVKIPAAWLIESCGLKGYRQADAGVHTNQPLVLVNYENSSGIEIYNLAKFIQNKVFDTYNISLEMEVNVV